MNNKDKKLIEPPPLLPLLLGFEVLLSTLPSPLPLSSSGMMSMLMSSPIVVVVFRLSPKFSTALLSPSIWILISQNCDGFNVSFSQPVKVKCWLSPCKKGLMFWVSLVRFWIVNVVDTGASPIADSKIRKTMALGYSNMLNWITGGGVCNTCGIFHDGFELLSWINGWNFAQSIEAIGQVLGIQPGQVPSKLALTWWRWSVDR